MTTTIQGRLHGYASQSSRPMSSPDTVLVTVEVDADEALKWLGNVGSDGVCLSAGPPIAPPPAVDSDRDPAKKNMDWLLANSHRYRGKWVALLDGVLLWESDVLSSVQKAALNSGWPVCVVRIPMDGSLFDERGQPIVEAAAASGKQPRSQE